MPDPSAQPGPPEPGPSPEATETSAPDASGPPAGPDRRRIAWAGGLALAALLLVATLLSLSHTEPTLRTASSVPTTTTTTTPSFDPIVDDPGSASVPTTTTAGSSSSSTAPPTTAAPLSVLPARTSRVATVRAGLDEVAVHPDATSGEVTQRVPAVGDYGQRQVFLVVGDDGGRLEVLLPVRPNGSRGWIDVADVDLTSHDYQIQVSLSGFQMLVQRGTDVVLDTAIGVGTSDTPTVGGDFYTWVLLAPTNSGYGSYAYGLSGFSTLESFNGGDGRMGIHGTTDASSIGGNVSHGCVRVPDSAVVEMVEEIGLPLGVPVSISA